MNGILRSEVIKFTTVRSSAWIVATAAVIAALAGTVLAAPVSEGVWAPVAGHPFLWTYMTIMGLVGYSVGARAVSDESRHRTMTWTALSEPRRERAVVAKGVVSALIGAGVTAVAVAATFTVVILTGPAELMMPPGDLLTLGVLFVAAGALWALLGVGVASVVQNPVGALLGGFAWFVIAEGAIGGRIGDAAWFLPGHAAGALIGAPLPGAPSNAEGAALFAGYALAALVIGTLFHRRRDIV